MDSSNIYYSDNSQLIESNNTEWINNTVLIDNQNLSWHDNGPEITVDYSESVSMNQTLTENDGYETADAGDSTGTSQYFSILESTVTEADVSTLDETPKCVLNVEIDKEETILPDVASNIESNIQELNLDDKVSDNEIILYRPEGSEELFAVQITEDEHGNLQKFKFQVRQNADGQFEAIPGTIEVENANDINSTDENSLDLTEHLQESVPSPIEQKPTELILSNEIEEQPNEITNENENSNMEINYIENDTENFITESLNSSFDQDQDEEYQTVDGLHVTGDSDSNSQIEYMDTRQFVKTNILQMDDDNSEEDYEIEELEEEFQNDNSNFEYDKDAHTENLIEYEIRENNSAVLQHKSNITTLKVATLDFDKRNTPIYKDNRKLFFVLKHKEKENVELNRKTVFNTSNMRSILKSNNPSFITTKYVYEQPTLPEKSQHTVPSIISNKESSSKNVMKSKDLKCTSPVKSKSARQPRKQSLTPVDRAGSEIIVQPLIYSLDDHTANDPSLLIPAKRKRITSEVLQVSDDDSDPEFVVKSVKKRRRGRPRKYNSEEITILDSEEEDNPNDNIIEVPSDPEEVEEISEENKSHEKTNRENSNSAENVIEIEDNTDNVKNSVKDNNEVTPTKENCVEPDSSKEEKITTSVKKVTNAKKNKCPHCPKTFPRLITLKRHINMHNVRRTLRSSQSTVTKSETDNNSKTNINEKTESKVRDTIQKTRSFNCTKCNLKFLLESQYKRHQSVHISKVNSKSNTKPKISPIKSTKYLRSSNKVKLEKTEKLAEKKVKINSTKDNFKCEFCGQSFSTRPLLFIHRNSHKTFPCPNCKTTFTAKLLLDDHLRKNCVKTPMKCLRQKIVNKPMSKKNSVKCEKCSRIFPNPRSLQIHHSVSHRRSVTLGGKINKDIPKKEFQLPVNKRAHGGVPMSLKMQKAFDKMKQKS